MPPLISIIIPVYKTEDYLNDCVQSIFIQSFIDYECILVDDGSPDNCPSLCDDYAKNNTRIKVIHKKNGGLSDARNVGISQAVGKYIIFLDSDDKLMDNNTLRNLFNIIQEYKTDVILNVNFYEFTDTGGKSLINNFNKDIVLGSPKTILEYFHKAGMYLAGCMFCCKKDYLIKNNLFFKKDILHEDEHWMPRVLFRTQKIAINRYPFYAYRVGRVGSITSQVTAKRLLSLFDIANDLLVWSKEEESYTKEGCAFMQERAELLYDRVYELSDTIKLQDKKAYRSIQKKLYKMYKRMPNYIKLKVKRLLVSRIIDPYNTKLLYRLSIKTKNKAVYFWRNIMTKFLKFIFKLFFPAAIRKKISYLMNLESHIGQIESYIGQIESHIGQTESHIGQTESHIGQTESHIGQIESHIGQIESHIGQIESHIGRNNWEMQKIKNIFLIKENSPLIFDKIKIPLIDDSLFVDLAGKHFLFPDIVELKKDFKDNARKIITRFACTTFRVPFGIVQNLLLKLMEIESINEYAFYYLVEILFPQYEDNAKAIILENSYSNLLINEYTDIWLRNNGILRWICFLMLRGEYEKAETIFLNNKEYFQDEDIASWIPVAHLAYKNNIQTEDIYVSAMLFKRFIDQSKIIDDFNKYLINKSIAIVGNGPYEKGTSHGDEIDNHDIVIRFNNFIVSDLYKKDYGSKFNIISNNGLLTEIPQRHTTAEFIVFPTSMYFHYISKVTRKFIYDNPDMKMVFFNMDSFKFFQNKYNCHRPTTGIRFIYYLINNLNIKKIDIYGFSINKVENSEYFNNSFDKTYSNEDLQHEHEIYKDLLKDIG